MFGCGERSGSKGATGAGPRELSKNKKNIARSSRAESKREGGEREEWGRKVGDSKPNKYKATWY